MKTALQELLEWVVENKGDINAGGCYTDIFIEITALLEKEKQQIIDAVNGYTVRDYLGITRGEQYYNEKYGGEK